MGKFDIYNISLKGHQEDIRTFEFLLDNDFFKKIDGNEVQKGKLTVELTVKKTVASYEFTFVINGTVQVPCDRCLDDMEVLVETTEKLFVKLGKEYTEESDNLIVIPEEESEINLAWFIYEFVALCIPMKHVHGPGKCNKTMSTKLKKHSAKTDDDEDDSFDFGEIEEEPESNSNSETDPRWDDLKKIIDNN
ncbi:MAG: YceD family protein [Bacteroidales bacterium]